MCSCQSIRVSFDKFLTSFPKVINRLNLPQGKANLKVEDSDGLTALLVAVVQGRASVIEVLVSNGKPLR